PGPAGGAAPHIPVRRARPERGRAHLGAGRGHVRRQAGRGVRHRGALPQPAPPLHRGAALVGADPEPAPAPRTAAPPGAGRAPPGGSRRRSARSSPRLAEAREEAMPKTVTLDSVAISRVTLVRGVSGQIGVYCEYTTRAGTQTIQARSSQLTGNVVGSKQAAL